MNSFQLRLNDPEIGDKIEVAWKGKFRLETQDVYQGIVCRDCSIAYLPS